MAASFPGSVKTWTPVVDNVDEILAAHVNEAYDEIIAIETATQGVVDGIAKNVVALNGTDIDWELGNLDATGNPTVLNSRLRPVNFLSVKAGTVIGLSDYVTFTYVLMLYDLNTKVFEVYYGGTWQTADVTIPYDCCIKVVIRKVIETGFTDAERAAAEVGFSIDSYVKLTLPLRTVEMANLSKNAIADLSNLLFIVSNGSIYTIESNKQWDATGIVTITLAPTGFFIFNVLNKYGGVVKSLRLDTPMVFTLLHNQMLLWDTHTNTLIQQSVTVAYGGDKSGVICIAYSAKGQIINGEILKDTMFKNSVQSSAVNFYKILFSLQPNSLRQTNEIITPNTNLGTIGNPQGVIHDGAYSYACYSKHLYKYDSAGLVLDMDTTTYGGTYNEDGCIVGDYIYLPQYTVGATTRILKINKTDLTFIGEYVVATNGSGLSSLTYKDGYFYGTMYDNPTTLVKYNVTFAKISEYKLSTYEYDGITFIGDLLLCSHHENEASDLTVMSNIELYYYDGITLTFIDNIVKRDLWGQGLDFDSTSKKLYLGQRGYTYDNNKIIESEVSLGSVVL